MSITIKRTLCVVVKFLKSSGVPMFKGVSDDF